MDDRTEPLIEVTVPAPVDEVWAHLRDPALIARWFGWEYDGLADEIDLIFLQAPTATEAAEPGGVRTLRWDQGDEEGDRIELLPAGDETVVRLTRSAPAEGWDGVFDDIGEGWISFVHQLRFAFAHHRGEERRTVFLAAPLVSGEPGSARAALGVAEAAGPGDALVGPVGPEAGWTGTIAFRTANQVGLAVDQLGPGLVVVLDKPAAAGPPHGSAMVTISAYGSSAAALAALEGRWTAWWTDHVGPPGDPLAV